METFTVGMETFMLEMSAFTVKMEVDMTGMCAFAGGKETFAPGMRAFTVRSCLKSPEGAKCKSLWQRHRTGFQFIFEAL
jgi:hypothetical protein